MIIVLPFCDADKIQAERLLDCIYWIGGQKPYGHLVIVSAPDVHPEYRIKMKLAGEIGFETVTSMELSRLDGENKIQKINSMFKQAGRFIHDCFKDPWLWLEPDCVPMKASWLDDLERAYESQPRRYMGRHMRGKDKIFLSRVAIYPSNAITDLDTHCSGMAPFERVAEIIPRSTMSTLFHIDKAFKTEHVVPETVALLNQEKTGMLIEKLIEDAPIKPLARARGRPRKVINEEVQKQ